jgi:hypothetical protein
VLLVDLYRHKLLSAFSLFQLRSVLKGGIMINYYLYS